MSSEALTYKPTNYLYICGTYRSGTTVTEKILNSHKNLCIGSQPFPLLYIICKERFNQSLGIQQTYPMDHRFQQNFYTDRDLIDFLDHYILNSDDLAEFSMRMKNYIGLWTPKILEKIASLQSGNFYHIYQQLMQHLHNLYGNERTLYIGSKEVLFEEYIPFLLSKKVKVILIIRDPRDMIASLNFNEVDNQTGDNRPVLYSLRNWRKSVAYSIQFENHPGFLSIQYENLVLDPVNTLYKISGFLGVERFSDDLLKQNLQDQDGSLWHGNSAFYTHEGISSRSVGSYVKKIDPTLVRYIENICLPEMKHLGYKSQYTTHFDPEVIRSYLDPFAKIHSSFPHDYSSLKEHCDAEIQRYNYLATGNCSPEKVATWFIYPKPYKILAQYTNR